MTGIWRVTLLTLLMALLPLRGWAWSVMPVGGGRIAAAVAQAEQKPVRIAPPCHAQEPAAADALTASPDKANASAPADHSASACAHCDLCHAAVICVPGWTWVHTTLPLAPPGWSVSDERGLDGQGGPFRPPRA